MLRRRFFYLSVTVCMLLGLAGPAQVLAAQPVQAPDLAPQAIDSVTLEGTVGSTPTQDSTPTTGTANNASSITFSHTTGSGNNRLLLVGVSFYNASSSRTISSVTFGGTALTSVAAATTNGNTRRVQIWRLIAPAASTTANIVVTFSGTGMYGVAGAVSFAGVDQCAPLGTYLGATGNTGTATVSPVTVAGDLVFDTVAAGSTLTVNGSQAPQWNTGDGTTLYGGASTKTATTSPTPMSWTLGASGLWATGAVAIKPVNSSPRTATATSGSTLSFCHTTGSGTDRLMLVGVSLNANTTAETISSITFTPVGGSAISLSPVITEQLPWLNRYSSIWYSPTQPPAGQTGTILVTLSASFSSGSMVVGSANFAGVDQITPLGVPKGTVGNGTAISLVLDGLTGDELVFDNVFIGGTSTTAATVGAGQTQVWQGFVSPGRGIASTEQASSNSVQMSWTAGVSALWVSVAVPIIPAYPSCTRYTLAAGNDGNGTVALNPPGGSYCSGRKVRLTPSPNPGQLLSGFVGPNGSEVTNTSGVHTIVVDGNKSVIANFAAQTCSDVSLDAADDTYLSGASTSTNYGASTTLEVAGTTTTTNQRTSLLRWAFAIPADTTIGSASISLNVTNNSAYAYPLYEVARAWVESAATWQSDGTANWQTAGASNSSTGSIDRGSTALWDSTGSFGGSPGVKTVTLNASGLGVVRRWATGGFNNGVIIQDYTAGASDNLIFDSSESTTEANRPKLTYNHCVPNNTAPNLPALVAPAPDGTTGVGTSPTLVVTVGDTDGNAMDVTFYGRAVGSGTWLNLGTFYAAPSASNASMAWPGLAASTQYEWYVDVDDGPATTTGATWTFTTAGTTGTIIVEKQTEPDGMTDEFTFTGDAEGNIADGGQIVKSGLAPGAYSSTEAELSYFNLVRITCDDDNSTGDLLTRTASFQLEAGETVKCTFLNVVTLDYGDAPDSYKTLWASDGARHGFSFSEAYLGLSKDNELDGHPGDPATGDDIAGLDDEDGVTLPATLVAGDTTASVSVDIYGSGKLDAWIDFDGNGVFDHTAEHLWGGTSKTLATGVHALTFAVPAGATPGITYARFRVSTAGSLDPFGYAADGEVEDYRVEIVAPPEFLDYGDAPDSYATLLASNGARHVPVSVFLGNARDTEADGQPSALANGDDLNLTDDEDGVTLAPSYAAGNAAASVTVLTAFSNAKLDAWIDFDASGTFEHPAEHLWNGTSQALPAGVATPLTFAVPATATPGTTYARFRLSTAGSLAPTGLAADGEVEDYQVTIVAPNHTVTFDANGGTGTMSPQVANAPTALTLNAFTFTGYTFSGWNTAADGSGTAYTDGQTYSFAADVTLYAQWTINQYSVTYNGNGSTGGSVPVDALSPYDFGATVTVLGAGTLVKTGYTFDTWNTQANGLGTDYSPADTFTLGAADVTLYAQWTINTYTVTYAGNGSTGGSVPVDALSPYDFGATVTVLGAGTLVKTGYTFDTWNTQANGLGTDYSPADTFTLGAADVTLYAQWTINQYTVTYAGNGSTGGTAPVDPSSPYNYGATVTVLGAGTLVKTGYTFDTWNTQANGLGTDYSPADTFTLGAADVTLYAQWTINQYTVTYAGNGSTGGTAPVDPSSPYNYGATVTVLGAGTLVKTGYTFDTWNTQANGLGTDYSPADTFTLGAADVTLYAQWTINQYSVTYNGNGSTGGSVPVDALSPYDFGATVTVLGAGTLVKTGYTFDTWNTQANGLGTDYSPADTFTLGAADVTLYAQWTINTYTVTYAGNGSTGGSVPVDALSPYDFGATVTVLGAGTLVKTGYTFDTWNTQANGLGTDYSPADTFTLGAADVTLYAQWTINTYTVTYAGNGSTGGSVPVDALSPYDFGATVTVLGAGTLVKTGYTFDTWNTQANGLGTDYSPADTFTLGAADVTLYAQWTINQYTVTYAGNTNTGGTAPVDGSSPYNYGATVTVLGAGTLVKTGYTFDTWNTQANGLGTDYSPADTFTLGAADVTLYAQWTINQYTVTYAGNTNTGGTAPVDGSSPYNYGATVTVLGAGTLVKTGYTFDTWNTQADGLGTDYSPADTFTLGAADVTLYAQWTINTYTVTYAGNGSTGGTAPVDGSSPYNYGATVTVLGAGTLVKTGFTFDNWNTQANGLGTDYSPADTFTLGAADVTLYAQWTALLQPDPPVVSIGPSQLTWDVVLHATKYQVYYDSAQPYFTPGDTPDWEGSNLYYPHPGGTANYYYIVRAVNVTVPSDNSKRVGRFSFQLIPGTEP